MSILELTQLHSLLNGAVIPEAVFESLRQGLSTPAAERIEGLEQEYLRLARLADPKLFVGNSFAQQMARRVMTMLYELHQQALQGLESELPIGLPPSPQPLPPATGSTPDPESLPLAAAAANRPPARFIVRTAKGSYEAEGELATGDLSTVFRAVSLVENDNGSLPTGSKLVLKVAFETSDNDLLSNEVRTLRLLEATTSPQRKHLPQLVDQFQTADGRVGTVLHLIDGFDLRALRARYPEGLPAEHGIWILRRLLSAVGYAHSLGIIHGNIEPSHVLVQPADHNVVLIDWCYSIVAPSRSAQGFRAHNPSYSPPEVAARKPPLPASDLYSIGKCMIYLLGGDLQDDSLPDSVEPRLARFIQFFVRPSARQRAQDAWEMYEKLKELRQEIFGPHRFLPLEM